MLSAFRHYIRLAVKAGNIRADEMEAELGSDEEDLRKRLERAEEQAAAAWDRVGKLEKVVEELRDAVASEIHRLEGHL